MPRTPYKIKKSDWSAAREWIENKLSSDYFLEYETDGTFNLDRRLKAEREWKKIDVNDVDVVDEWCNKWLRASDWTQLKTAIRVARARKKKHTKSINLDSDAWYLLYEKAEKWDLTLSDTIRRLVKMADGKPVSSVGKSAKK